MKTGFLILISFGILFVSALSFADALCMPNTDWPDAPCYGRPGAYPGLEQEKLDWASYYDYKGSVWMDAKKQQIDSAIHNNSLREWFKQDDAHKNAHKYYFLHGDVPNIYGMTFDEMLGFEQVWDAVENNSSDAPLLLWNYHDVILDGEIVETDLAVLLTGDDVPLHHLKVNKYFKGDRNSDMISAIDNFSDLEFELFENGLFYLKKLDNQNLYTVTVASIQTFGTCDARDLIEISPVLPNEKSPISMPAGPIGVDPCIPSYFETDPDAISYQQDTACNISDADVIRSFLDGNPTVNEFLGRHPSAEFIFEPTYDEPSNPRVTATFVQNGISLDVVVTTHDKDGNCYGIGGYMVSYDMPSKGVGVSLSRTHVFEPDQISETITAIKDTTNPFKQMKMGIPLYAIKCKEGLTPIVRIDRVHPACVTDDAWSKLLQRGWTPLRLGMPAETNILITYDAISVYPYRHVQDFNPDIWHDNMIYWVNNDVVAHTIVAEDGSWSVGPIETGRTDGIMFNNTGVYSYFVKENPDTTGRLVFERGVFVYDEIDEDICSDAILDHLLEYSNLFEPDFDGKYGIEDVGLPDGVTEENLQTCVNHVYEQRTLME